jgi:hypothetical protein
MESGMGVSEHLQSAMRLGSARDIYYYGRESLHKQSIPTIVDNRFKQALNNLRQGSSTFIISVDEGISDIMLGVKLPEDGNGVDYTNLALPRGWLYDLIARCSARYSGSSQYFWTGGQIRIENLREMPNPTTRDKLFELGGALMLGNATAGAGDFAGDNLYAYAYINLPHNSPNGSLAKPNPFPSEMLSQPIVITCELNALPSIFSTAVASGSLAGAPTALEDAWFQVKQVHAKDRGELMVSMADRSKAYSFPTKCFYQNEITVGIPALNPSAQPGTPAETQVLLTGFRAGEVRSIIMWLTEDGDINPTPGAPYVKNFTNFALPHDVQILYNGTVYYDAQATSSQFWNLVSAETPAQLQATVLSINAGAIVATPKVASWVEIPFSQVYEQLSGSHMYVAGKLIMNSTVNASLVVPDATKAYTLHAVYSYNCVMAIADGSVSYVF